MPQITHLIWDWLLPPMKKTQYESFKIADQGKDLFHIREMGPCDNAPWSTSWYMRQNDFPTPRVVQVTATEPTKMFSKFRNFKVWTMDKRGTVEPGLTIWAHACWCTSHFCSHSLPFTIIIGISTSRWGPISQKCFKCSSISKISWSNKCHKYQILWYYKGARTIQKCSRTHHFCPRSEVQLWQETISKVHLLGGNELRLVAHSLSGSEHGLLELCGTVSLEAQPNIHWQDGEIWLRKWSKVIHSDLASSFEQFVYFYAMLHNDHLFGGWGRNHQWCLQPGCGSFIDGALKRHGASKDIGWFVQPGSPRDLCIISETWWTSNQGNSQYH